MATDPDLTEFEQLSAQRSKRRPCQAGAALAALKEAERAQLSAALAKPVEEITSGAIQQWLAKREISANVPSITAHRRRNCACHG